MYNLENEKLLLGSLLNNNELYNEIKEILDEEHFYLEIHKKIYKAIVSLIEQGLIADPVALKNTFDQQDDFKEYNGGMYLFKLAKESLKDKEN